MASAAPNMAQLSIHSELLCFLNNKIQTAPFEVIVKQCMDFYSGDQIQAGKDLLWDTAIAASPTLSARKEMRNIRRKNTGAKNKERLDMEDIVKALQVCDKEGITLPSYYALDLGNIPPVSMEQMDVSVIMGQLSTMQREMKGQVQLWHLCKTHHKGQSQCRQHHGPKWLHPQLRHLGLNNPRWHRESKGAWRP